MEKLSLGKSALRYGLITGVLLIIFSLIMYIMEVDMQSKINYLSSIILLVMGIVAASQWRDKHNDGNLSYGQGLGTGTLVGLYAGIITAIYMFVFFKYIDPAYVDRILEITEQKMYDQNPNMTSSEVEMALDITKRMTSPIIMSLLAVLGNTFWSFILSLIYSIFLKRSQPVQFDDAE